MRFIPRIPRSWIAWFERFKESTAYWAVYPIALTLSSIAWTGRAIYNAWGTRRFRHFVHGIPALLGLALVIVGASFVFAGRSQERRGNLSAEYMGQCGVALRKASGMKEKEPEYFRQRMAEARCFAEKAIVLASPDRDDLKFTLAQILAMSDQKEHCRAMMEKLAPDESNGYGPAHMWRGDFYSLTMSPSPEVLKAIERHYTRAYESLKAKSDTPEANQAALRLGLFYVRSGRLNDAVKYLEMVEDQFPAQRLLLSELYTRMGRTVDAARLIGSAERHYRAKVKDSVDDVDARLQWAAALTKQEKFPEAMEALRKGHTLTTDVRITSAMVELFSMWEMSLAKQRKDETLPNQVSLIQQGLILAPSNVYLLTRMMEISSRKGPEGEKAKQILQDMLVNGNSAPIIQHLLAMQAHAEGRLEEAKFHWEKSLATDTQVTPIVMNNLAWIYCHMEKPDLERALNMIDMVIAKYPALAAFYGTRGEVLARLKRYKEALPDLEKGVKEMQQSVELHVSLAECYDNLGVPSMAEAHRRRVTELRKGRPSGPPAASVEKPPTGIAVPKADIPALPVEPTRPGEKPKDKDN